MFAVLVGKQNWQGTWLTNYQSQEVTEACWDRWISTFSSLYVPQQTEPHEPSSKISK